MAMEMKEIVEKIKAAKTPEEVSAIVKEMPKVELSAEEIGKVAGGTGRIELTEAQADKVVGGGHLYTDSMGQTLWLALVDDNYVLGEDDWYDRAFALEQMALAGFRVYDIIDAACAIFTGANPIDVENALRVGGPAYLADCYRVAHGYHW